MGSNRLSFAVLLLFAACGDDDPTIFPVPVDADVTSDVEADAPDVTDTTPQPDVEVDGTDVPRDAPADSDDTGGDPPMDVPNSDVPDSAPDAEEDLLVDADAGTPDADESDSGCDDSDDDGVCDVDDRCPGSPDGEDADSDGVPDGCDNCPSEANPSQLDSDGDWSATAAEIDYQWRLGLDDGLTLADDEVRVVEIGFDWEYFGLVVDEIAVSSNGFLSVDLESGDGCCTGGILGGAASAGGAEPSPPGVIAGFWEDLSPPEGGRIRYGTLGEPGTRAFVVAFEDVSHCCGTVPSVAFQMVLLESGGAEVHCRDCGPTFTPLVDIATQGVQSPHGRVFASMPGRNAAEWSALEDGVEFGWTSSPGDGVGDVCDPCPFDAPDDSDGDGVCDSDE